MEEPTLKDIMVHNVTCVSPDMTVEQVRQKIIESTFHGFPIVENGYLLGYISAKELLRHIDKPDAKIRTVMKSITYSVEVSESIQEATRRLFRYGLRNLPVVDEQGKIVGIVSSIDIIRSQIERTHNSKVETVKNFLEKHNGLKLKLIEKDVPLEQIIPTQKSVRKEELEGRKYEIKRGLNEKIITIQRRNGYLLVDGHHRAIAARDMGLKTFKSIVLVPNDLDVKLGLEKTAEKWGLRSLDDVHIDDGREKTEIEVMVLASPGEEASSLNQRLMENEQ